MQGVHAALSAELALCRGDLTEVARQLDAARGYFGAQDYLPHHEIPLARLAGSVAAADGRIPDARDHLTRVLDRGFPPGAQRYRFHSECSGVQAGG
ncbi:hypothetical protein ABZ330_28715 [Streptomyces sp. NPDC006172]|uniref:hypothetical protein n=1 Tax=Streptomyces sp. NPDC006172 TaxID=3154470 RepID=UPI003407015F